MPARSSMPAPAEILAMINKDGFPDFCYGRMRAAANPYDSQRLRQPLRVFCNLRFDLADDRFCLLFPAMNNEPARTFRHRVAQEDDDDSQYGANAEYQPPAY